MIEKIVYTTTKDSFEQTGALIRPDGPAKPTAVVWMHGFAGNFYEKAMIEIGRNLALAGYAFICGNNRGHDFGSMYYPGGVPTLRGGGWELLEESAHDIRAWIRYAEGLGFESVILVGHSLGSHKAVFYQAEHQDPRIVGLVTASPPLRAGAPDPAVLSIAKEMCARGGARDLLPWGSFPIAAGSLSAGTYVSFKCENRPLFLESIGRVKCPILVFFGTEESWIGTESDLEVVRKAASASPQVRTLMVEGADHSYGTRTKEVAGHMIDWMDSVLPR